jgi:hypothetical protein
MVFWVDGAPWIATLHDEHLGWGNGGVWCGSPGRDFAFLGCNPAHATRADCERFGLAPDVDAGAHGFARTRDGFAVDLRRVAPPGTVYRNAFGARYTKPEGYRDGLLDPDRFIGLDARHASAEDVERLCCGAYQLEHASPDDTFTTGRRCTLAIGPHDTHEDIATGVKWAAERPIDRAFSYPSTLTASATVSAEDFNKATDAWAHEPLAFHSGPTSGGTVALTAAGGRINDGPNALRLNTQALCSGRPIAGTLDVSGLSEWQMQAMGAPAKPTFDITATMEPFADAFRRLAASAMSASESMLHAFAPAAGFCTFIANLKAHDARERREKEERRLREAALVALVNAVPKELDPVGWRAAVLAVRDFWNINRAVRDWPRGEDGKDFANWLLLVEHCEPGWFPTPRTAYGAGFDAYRRAIAPHKAPSPEKRRGGKAVLLTVDDGRDDD